ncbi:MAG TPA: S-layer homology domain-containing protein [Syntrophomonadaceae bacterium]|nr:S-layer homology domain-containing protein [Syntrophomonadaceae bacterium]
MKRFLSFLLVGVFVFTIPSITLGEPPDFNGGVNNEYEYEEVVFVSGTPIKFVGDIDISKNEKADTASISYKYKLVPADKNVDGSINRRITYEIDYARRNDKGQTIAQTNLKTYRETIQIDANRYVLSDYQISKSDVIDNRPASDFSSGTITARKVYDINRNEGKVIVDFSGGDVGYKNFWGSTETQILEYDIESESSIPATSDSEDNDNQDVSWQGTVTILASDSMNKSLQYTDNQASLSSFTGGHLRLTNQEMFSRYDYNLPYMTDGVPSTSRNRGSIELNKSMLPKIERLLLPKLRDIGGHWAQDDIGKLYSLDVFEGNSPFFAPDAPMTRIEFTTSIMKACNIRVLMEEPKRTSRRTRNTQAEVSPFKDIRTSDENYNYVKEAVNKGIISGVSQDFFMPEDQLTRAQAITILMRALGFENKAPTPGYMTSFADDYSIPEWSKDSFYVAKEIGLVYGDTANRANPNQTMTRAEASALIVRFLSFLERDLQIDYREDIILYN